MCPTFVYGGSLAKQVANTLKSLKVIIILLLPSSNIKYFYF
jgi:hypothetical protein